MLSVFQDWDVATKVEATSDALLRVCGDKVVQNYGLKIQEARLKKRLSLHDLARMIDRDAHALAMCENGIERPSSDMLQLLQDALGVQLREAA